MDKCKVCKTEVEFSLTKKSGILSTTGSSIIVHHTFQCPTCKTTMSYRTIEPADVYKHKPEQPKPNTHYVYCPSCGYENFDCYVGYSRTTANGDWYICPGCGEETSSVDIGE